MTEPRVIGQSLSLRSSKISSGSYADVYWDRLSRDQVVKVLKLSNHHASLIRDISLTGYFIQEAKDFDFIAGHRELLSDLRSRRWGISMTYGGEDLSKIMRLTQVPMPTLNLKDRLEISKQALVALYRLHEEAGIVHRDLKPANMFWNDKTRKLVLGDFNMSLLVEVTPFNRDLGVQTRWFRAPEVLLGDKSYTTKVDVWSLGVILLALWTGYLPKGTSALEQLWMSFALGGTPAPKSYLTGLSRWKRLQFEGRSMPVLVGHKRRDGFFTTSFLETHLDKISCLSLQSLLRAMLQVDPTRRPTVRELLATNSFCPPDPLLPLKSPRPFPPYPPCLQEAVVEGLEWGWDCSERANLWSAISPDVWIGYSAALFHLASRMHPSAFNLWVSSRTKLSALHYCLWVMVDDYFWALSGLMADVYRHDPAKEVFFNDAITTLFTALPSVLSIYRTHPWTCALRQTMRDRGLDRRPEKWAPNRLGKRKHLTGPMKEVYDAVKEETFKKARDHPSRLDDPKGFQEYIQSFL